MYTVPPWISRNVINGRVRRVSVSAQSRTCRFSQCALSVSKLRGVPKASAVSSCILILEEMNDFVQGVLRSVGSSTACPNIPTEITQTSFGRSRKVGIRISRLMVRV